MSDFAEKHLAEIDGFVTPMEYYTIEVLNRNDVCEKGDMCIVDGCKYVVSDKTKFGKSKMRYYLLPELF